MADEQPFLLRVRELRERSKTIADAAKKELLLTGKLALEIRVLKSDFLRLAVDMEAAGDSLEGTEEVATIVAFLEEMFAHFDARLIREHLGDDKPTLQ